MITDNLTNTVYFSSLLPEKCPILSASISEVFLQRGISFDYLKGTKDIWCRDYMPIQIQKDRLIAYKYTPDYLQDKRYIRLQTNPEDVLQAESNVLFRALPTCRMEDVTFDSLRPTTIGRPTVETFKMDLVMDGGNVVKCGDTVVMTEKVFVENNDKSRDKVEQILRDAFQCDLLFLPWDRKEYLGHSDGIVHYAGDGKILLTNYNDFSIYFYRHFLKTLGTRFEVIPLKYHVKRKHARSWSYINFLQVGKLVLVPQLGVEEDRIALEQIGNTIPDCEVVGIPALEAVRRGGALNCISWNIQN
jgi:hypothetical protein